MTFVTELSGNVISITAPENVSSWLLCLGNNNFIHDTLNVTADGPWVVEASDQNTTTGGYMMIYNVTNEYYVAGTRLATPLNISASGGEVDLSSGGGEIANGTSGENISNEVTFKQSVTWADMANDSYRIVVTFTGSLV